MWLALRVSVESGDQSVIATMDSRKLMDQVRELQAIALDLRRDATWSEIYAANDDRADMYGGLPMLAY